MKSREVTGRVASGPSPTSSCSPRSSAGLWRNTHCHCSFPLWRVVISLVSSWILGAPFHAHRYGSSVSPFCPGLRLPVTLELIPAPSLASYPPVCLAHHLPLPALSLRHCSDLPFHRLRGLNSYTRAWVTATASYLLLTSRNSLASTILSGHAHCCQCWSNPAFPLFCLQGLPPPDPCPWLSWFLVLSTPCPSSVPSLSHCSVYPPNTCSSLSPAGQSSGSGGPASVAQVLITPVSGDSLRACKVPGAVCFLLIFPLPSVSFTFMYPFCIAFFSTYVLYRV